MNKDISDDEKVKRIALKMIPMVGDVVAKSLTSYFGSATSIFKSKASLLQKIPGIGNVTATNIAAFKNFELAEKELAFITKHNIETYFFTEDNYPFRLKQLTDSPYLLYFRGKADLNHTKIISVVGTRAATDYGKRFCNELIEALAPHQVMVVSGLAYGIDITAHKAAIKNKLPTIGVLAHGLDRLYPSSHKSVAINMIEHGGVLSEYRSGTPPDRENFPERNRIVAGMSDAVIVVEAAIKGGALITAEYGNSYNKDVFALPGRNTDEFSAGCNKLIKTNKAALITSADDLIYIMGWEQHKKSKKSKQATLLLNLTPLEQLIIDQLTLHERIHIDLLTHQCKTPNSELALILLNLEFNGIVKSLPGNYYMRT